MFGVKTRARETGLLELELLKEHGGIIPAGELSKMAKKLGVSESSLLAQTEPIGYPKGMLSGGPWGGEKPGEKEAFATNYPEGITGYKFPGAAEKEARKQQIMAAMQESIARKYAASQLGREVARTRETAEAAAEATIPAEKEIAEYRKDMQLDIAAVQDTYQKKAIKLTDKLRKSLTPEAKAKLESETVENLANARYLDRLAASLSGADKPGLQRYKAFMANAGKMGLTRMVKGAGNRTIEQLKPVIRGSKEHTEMKALLKAQGLDYHEVETGKGFLGLGDQRIRVEPIIPQGVEGSVGGERIRKKETPDMPSAEDMLSKGKYSPDKNWWLLPDGRKLQIRKEAGKLYVIFGAEKYLMSE